MASGALSRSLGCCSASMRRSYASLSSSCRLDGAWTGYYGPDFVPPVTRTLAGATTGILPFATSQLCAWQLQMPTASQVIGRLSGILPRAWVDGLTDGLVLTSHQTYRPKVLKRKREHGFLKRCGNYSFHTHLGNVLKPSAACVSTIAPGKNLSLGVAALLLACVDGLCISVCFFLGVLPSLVLLLPLPPCLFVVHRTN